MRTFLTDNGYEFNLELSRNVWYHILAIMSSPAYNDEPFVDLPGGKENRIPFPENSELLTNSAELGQVIAALQTGLDNDLPASEEGREQAILGFIDNPEFRFADITDENRTQAAITGTGITLYDDHSKSDKRSHRDYQTYGEACQINPEDDYIQAIADSFEIESEEVAAILGNQTVSLHLNETIVLSGVPRAVCDLEIGTHRVLGQWLAWRCSRWVTQASIQPEMHTMLRRLIRRLMHQLLLGGTLSNNYTTIAEDALEYNPA